MLHYEPRKLRERRIRRDLSRAQLAVRAGIGYSTLCSYEVGKQTPGLDAALRLSEALACSPTDFCEWDD